MFINDLFFKIHERIEISPAKRDRLIFVSLAASAVLNTCSWAIILVFFLSSSEFVVLQYNIYFGISSLGPWPLLFLLPLSGLAVAALNFSLSFYFYLKDKALSLFLAAVALAFQMIMFAALCLVAYMNL